jgi:hypothetical protein
VALYERLRGYDDAGENVSRIVVGGFCALLNEVARGARTGAQARAAVVDSHMARGIPLTASEESEVTALLATITGSATAKLARAQLIADVLFLAELRTVGYRTDSEIKTRLGV